MVDHSNLKLRLLKLRNEIKHFLIFGLIAISLDYMTYNFLILIKTNIVISKSFGFSIGAVFSFLANRNITFNNKNNFWCRLSKFTFLYLTTLMLNVFVNSTSLEIFARYNFRVQVSFLFATMISAITNFVGMKYIVFKKS